MEITEKLWSDDRFCPNGVTCEGTWRAINGDTPGKLRRIKRHRILDAGELAAIKLHCEPDEFVVFVPDEHC